MKLLFLLVLCSFIVGILTAAAIQPYLRPMEILLGISGAVVAETRGPSDVLNEKDILVYPDRVVLLLRNATVVGYEDTGSMEPTLQRGTNGIRIVPRTEKEIEVGDIITFARANSSQFIVHRVVEKGSDDKGIFFITRGDSAEIADDPVRFSEIRYKTIALVY